MPPDDAPSDEICGIFGGTFDPIHYGHIAPLREVWRAAGLAEIRYIPAAVPPHRPPPVATAAHRLAMTRLALAQADAPFVADDIELRRAAPSFTFDTVTALQRANPKQRFALILGADSWRDFDRWHRARDLQRCVHIIVINRAGWELSARAGGDVSAWWSASQVESAGELRRASAGKILIIQTQPTDISATQIRARIAAGDDATDLTPGAVCDYIREHNLYESPP